MKYFACCLIIICSSCGASQRLFVDKGNFSEMTIGKEEVFAGIRSLVAEKKRGKEKIFTLILDCVQQSTSKKPELTKVVWTHGGADYVAWIGVTDTTNTLKYFNTTISKDRVTKPLNFVKVEVEDVLLMNRLRASSSNDCLDLDFGAIIGYIQVRKSR